MSSNPLHAQSLIYMLAVVRFSDKKVVASYSMTKEVTKEGIRECIAGNGNIQIGKRYTSQGDTQSIHYIMDAQGRVYTLVSSPRYSPRIAFAALSEFQQTFGTEYGEKIANATEDGLNRSSSNMLRDLSERFANPSKIDSISSVQEKVDVVKSTMKENIQQLLINQEKVENIESTTIHLNEQSIAFKNQSKQLSDKMWWKMWKMRLLIGGLICLVLIVIVVPTIVVRQKH